MRLRRLVQRGLRGRLETAPGPGRLKYGPASEIQTLPEYP